jgi:quercetin dioxygenase-like cupin family protein
MKSQTMMTFNPSIALVFCIVFVSSAIGQTGTSEPRPRLIQLNQIAVKSSDVFNGPPETVSMLSGYMVLPPSKSVGKHSTKSYEEAVIVLSGSGEMRITGGTTFNLKPYTVAYCPPLTEHDVINTGSDTLRYIWLVAKGHR